MEIAAQAAGKAPINSGTVTAGVSDGHTAVVAAVAVGVTLHDGLFGSAMQHILFGSVCGPEDGKQAGSMFSRGPGGERRTRGRRFCQNAMLAWHDTYPLPCWLSRGLTLSKTEVNERQKFLIFKFTVHKVIVAHTGQ